MHNYYTRIWSKTLNGSFSIVQARFLKLNIILYSAFPRFYATNNVIEWY